MKKLDLGKDKISSLVWRMAIPSMIGQFINVLYSIVDRIYIGHLPNDATLALAGVGISAPIVTMIGAFASLIGIGGGPIMAIAMGEGNDNKAKKVVANAFNLLLIIGISLIFIVRPFSSPMLKLFGASDNILPFALDYFNIYILGTVFSLLSIGMNNFINSQGHSNTGMISVAIGAIVNIILDPIFMFKLNLGIKGAALATVISQFVSASFVLGVLLFKKLPVNLRFDKPNLKISFEIVKIGITPFLIIAFDNIMLIAMNAILNFYGGNEADLYLGVNTIAQSFMLVCTMPLGAISGTCGAILSFNYGAYNTDRVKEGIKYISKVCMLYTSFMFIIAMFFSRYFILLFNDDLIIVEKTIIAIRYLSIFIIPLGLQYALVDSLTALGQIKLSLPLSFFRKGVYFIALFLLPRYLDVQFVFLAEAISDIIPPIVSFMIVKGNLDPILQWRLSMKQNY